MIELKACPFCKCEMELKNVGRDWFRIKPVDAHEDMCVFDNDHEFDCSQAGEESQDEHIAEWNNRPAESMLCDELESMKKQRDELKSGVEYAIDSFGNRTSITDNLCSYKQQDQEVRHLMDLLGKGEK